jgi:putative FmdB family regulatory protein
MPTYEYRCAAGHQFEHFQRMSEAPLERCTQCGAPAERLLSAGAGLLFKGSGFYITDYRSESYKKAAAAEGGGSSDKGKSSAAGGSSDKGKSSAAGGSGASDSGSANASKGSAKDTSGGGA